MSVFEEVKAREQTGCQLVAEWLKDGMAKEPPLEVGWHAEKCQHCAYVVRGKLPLRPLQTWAIRPLVRQFKMPKLAYGSEFPGSVGYDLHAVEDGAIPSGATSLVRLGFCAEFDPGFACLLWDRSGLGSRGIHRFAGVIDPTYRDEWKVALHNSTQEWWRYSVGDRIVQAIFQRVEYPIPFLLEELSKSGREGGFGSSGA